MDAGIVLTTPPPLVSTTDSAPNAANEDAEAFASHLSADAQGKTPSPRKPALQTNEEAAPDAPPANDTGLAQSYAMSQPAAPVVVRVDGAPAIIDFALKPTVDAPLAAQTAPAAPAAVAPLAPPPQGAAPTPGAVPDAVPPASPTAAPLDANALPQTAPAPSAPAPLDIAALAATPLPAAGKGAVAPTESLRASGRSRAATSDDAPPTAAKAAAPAALSLASARPDIAPAAAPSPQGAQTKSDSAPLTPTLTEITSATTTAHRTTEAAPSAVHRPPTIAQTVAQHVIRRFEGQSTSIEVRLDPAELGRVQVKLDVGADSRVTAVVAADNPATLSDLMRSARELERALESAGLELASGGLSFDLTDRGHNLKGGAGEPGGMRTGGDVGGESVETTAPASRPFGLETWRGVRVDVTV